MLADSNNILLCKDYWVYDSRMKVYIRNKLKIDEKIYFSNENKLLIKVISERVDVQLIIDISFIIDKYYLTINSLEPIKSNLTGYQLLEYYMELIITYKYEIIDIDSKNVNVSLKK